MPCGQSRICFHLHFQLGSLQIFYGTLKYIDIRDFLSRVRNFPLASSTLCSRPSCHSTCALATSESGRSFHWALTAVGIVSGYERSRVCWVTKISRQKSDQICDRPPE